MAFKLVSIDPDGIAQVALSGEVDHDPASGKQNPLAHCLGEQWAGHRVLLDMDQAEYLNSTALGWLLQSQKAFDKAGGKLVIHSVAPSVQQVIRMMRIDKVLTLAPDADRGRQLLTASASGDHPSGSGTPGSAPGSDAPGSGSASHAGSDAPAAGSASGNAPPPRKAPPPENSGPPESGFTRSGPENPPPPGSIPAAGSDVPAPGSAPADQSKGGASPAPGNSDDADHTHDA